MLPVQSYGHRDDLCSGVGARRSALQLLLHTADNEQMQRRLDRFLEMDAHGEQGWLPPHVRGQQLTAMAALRQMLMDTGVFSDDEDGAESDEDHGRDSDGSVAGDASGDASDNDMDSDDGGDEAAPRLLGARALAGATTADDYGTPPPSTAGCPSASCWAGTS